MSNILEMPDETSMREILRKYEGLPKDLAAQLIDERRAELMLERQNIERDFLSKEEHYRARLRVLEETEATMKFLAKSGEDGFTASACPSITGPLRAHKFLSFLSGDNDGGMLDDPSVKRMFDYIKGAEKFSFYSAVCGENFDYLSDFGKDLFSAGIVSLPHERVYFEIGIKIAGQDMICAMWGGEDNPAVWFYLSQNYGVSWAPCGAINRNTAEPDTEWEEEKRIVGITRSLGDIFYACIALLASTSVIVSDEIVSASTNRKRIESGKVPLYSHRVVTINHTTVRGQGTGGTHAPPRLHWRRGHVRRYASGREVWIAPTLVGCADRGIVTHDYRVK
jgi:hypothetical protein